jgi:hypothetical protein
LDYRELDVIRRDYDALAEDYARNIYGELQHKPLDRELLLRLAKSLRPGLWAGACRAISA